MNAHEHARRSRRIKLIINIVTFLALGGLLFALRDSIGDALGNLDNLNLIAIVLMVPLQLVNYHAYTRMYQSLFELLGHTMGYSQMFKHTLELNFVNTVFPSGGVSGFSYFSLRMKRYGISTAKSTLVQTMRFILLFLSFQVLLALGLFLLALNGRVSNMIFLVAGSISTVLFIATFGIAFVIGSKTRIDKFFTFITRVINRVIHILRPNRPETINVERARAAFTELNENFQNLRSNPRLLKKPILFSLAATSAEILTIYTVYLAFGELVNPGAIILAYGIANFAGLVSVLPGGVGVYEALMTAVLAAAGVPAHIALPATITYRVISMMLQLTPGYFFYHKSLREPSVETA